jgi:hypothetical protein
MFAAIYNEKNLNDASVLASRAGLSTADTADLTARVNNVTTTITNIVLGSSSAGRRKREVKRSKQIVIEKKL